MSGPSLMYYQPQLGLVNPQTLSLVWTITGAGASTMVVPNSAVLSTYGAIASQSVIDSFLGTSGEFPVAAFDATSMGADAFGVIINMAGQARSVVGMMAYVASGADTVFRGAPSGTLTASTLETAVQVGADGNIALKVSFGNTPDFDGLTSGIIKIDVLWVPK
jgi:hypothetical protein